MSVSGLRFKRNFEWWHCVAQWHFWWHISTRRVVMVQGHVLQLYSITHMNVGVITDLWLCRKQTFSTTTSINGQFVKICHHISMAKFGTGSIWDEKTFSFVLWFRVPESGLKKTSFKFVRKSDLGENTLFRTKHSSKGNLLQCFEMVSGWRQIRHSLCDRGTNVHTHV